MLDKAVTYLRRWDSYWRLAPREESLLRDAQPLGLYPLDLRPRLEEGHYRFFDDAGVPLWPCEDGRPVYHITTMTSYALAHWQLYFESGGECHLQAVITIAERLAGRPRTGRELILLDGTRNRLVSAMSQGEGMSVLCRAWQATRESRFLDAALACLAPFERSLSEGGVTGLLGPRQTPWFEEFTGTPARHILNGMVYALWGLRDLEICTGDARAGRLFRQGVESVGTEAGAFDLGWWSRYWVPEPPAPEYPASMMYHNLHICQLLALAEQTADGRIARIAGRFLAYAKRPLCRIRAAVGLVLAKAEHRGRVAA